MKYIKGKLNILKYIFNCNKNNNNIKYYSIKADILFYNILSIDLM